jgi:hypothetical protein
MRLEKSLLAFSLTTAVLLSAGCGSSVKDPLDAALDKNGVAKAFSGTWVADVDFGTSPNGEKDTKHYELTFNLNPTKYTHGTFKYEPDGNEGPWTVLDAHRASNGTYGGQMDWPTPGKWDFSEMTKTTFTQDAGGGLMIKWHRK